MNQNFEFISDERFRLSIQDDYGEMLKAKNSNMWKATHILAGSIVEALLVSSLIDIDYQPNDASKSILHIQLHEAIIASQANSIISESISDVSRVIKNYRNLIHPGRVIRLSEEISEETATVAVMLVNMVSKEIERRNKVSYGFTAKQIVSRVTSDPVSMSILQSLLASTKSNEKLRLLKEDIFQKHTEICSGDDLPFHPDLLLDILRNLYSQVFKDLDHSGKQLIGDYYSELITRGDSSTLYMLYLLMENYYEFGMAFYFTDVSARLIEPYFLKKFEDNSPLMFKGLNGFSLIATEEVCFTIINRLIFYIANNDNSISAEDITRLMVN